MADAYTLGPTWFGFAIERLFGSATQAQIANVAAAAALTTGDLTVADGAGTNDGTIGAITADASVIAAVQEIAAKINLINDDLAEIRTQLNAEIAAIKAAGMQATS